MAGGFKVGRMSEDIKRELSCIMRELKDPRVKKAMLSIASIELSNDLSHCKIFISAIEGIDAAKEAVAGLTSATGFIKREIMKKLSMRKCPDFKFIADDSIEHSADIYKMLEDLN